MSSLITRLMLLLVMLLISGHSTAWIAYGFNSGMSRFDVMRYLSDNESFVINDDKQQTYAGPIGDKTKYQLVYCAKPQRLYLMKYSLDDSLGAFVETKQKYEKRYGEPTPLGPESDHWNSEAWHNADVSFIWDLNEFETILLTHSNRGTRAEFQDLSVCK